MSEDGGGGGGAVEGRVGMESGKNLAGKREVWDSTWSQDSGKINS